MGVVWYWLSGVMVWVLVWFWYVVGVVCMLYGCGVCRGGVASGSVGVRVGMV